MRTQVLGSSTTVVGGSSSAIVESVFSFVDLESLDLRLSGSIDADLHRHAKGCAVRLYLVELELELFLFSIVAPSAPVLEFPSLIEPLLKEP